MIRVFVAIPIPEELQKEIFAWEKNYKNLPVRWGSGQSLHITLVPPWYAEDANCAVGELSDIQSAVKPFEIRFDRVSFGTRPDAPRLIWAWGKEAGEEILKLKSVAEAVFGQRPEKRPYNPHLTLARFKDDDFKSFPIKHLEEKIDWKMKADSVALYESRLHHSGAEYEILKEIKLNA
ncbi:MAG: RNA 2',3'-cyclic phosphodiesterase [Candidatus Liptonbacteria bacterium]|nr:RNA 2',3'-cyclic phosphodiesterase [Candidatus Liptonbacteria bacterium]